MTPIDPFVRGDRRDDPEQWEALARRIVTEVSESKHGGLEWLSTSRVAVLTVFGLMATAFALITWPSAGSNDAGPRPQWTGTLAPADEVGRSIVLRDEPPAVGALMLDTTTGRDR